MISVFTANTDGFKRKFTISFAIKFFTKWYLKEFKKRHPEFSWMKLKDLPTHGLVGKDTGKTGREIIFESSKTQQIYPYYPSQYEFVFVDGIDVELFWQLVYESVGDWYGFFQLYYFIKTWWWETFFPEWFIRFWAKLFHGGKDILQWGNPFVSFQICTEQCYNLMDMYSQKYIYPETTRQLARANSNNIFPLLLLDMCLTLVKEKEMTRR